MGLVQAVKGAVGGVLADQWKDFFTVPAGLPSTAALFAAVPRGTNAGRGSNTSASSNIISNGSKIVVPEGYGLLLFQDGAITGFVAEPGGYEWRSDDLNSQSIFAGDGVVTPLIKQSWERFKFGGQPGAQQAAYFVSLKELPDNRFGTQSEIYWDDGFLGTQVGAVTRGSYTLKIVDPILFVKNFVPASYLQPGQVFDFTDLDNAAASQLFNEVVGSLAPAFSLYTNDPGKGNRITKLQQDSLGFAKSLSDAVEQAYQCMTPRAMAYDMPAYDTSETLKAIVIMTDGEFNSPYCSGVISRDAGPSSGDNRYKIDCAPDNDDPFDQSEALCDGMKAQGIMIYTVGLGISSTGEAADLLRYCATGTSNFHMADDADDLAGAFAAIGRDITQLRISK